MNNRILKLPIFLKPEYETKLIRIGKDNDGGYLISEESLKSTKILQSFGVSDDWSFEEDLYNKTKSKVFAYDPSVNWKFWTKKLFSDLKKIFFFEKKTFKEIMSIFLYIKYKKFFNNKDKFHVQKIIAPNRTTILGFKKEQITDLNDLMNDANEKNTFFKIDIEGSEYRILDQLIKYQKYMTGLVIEFHNCDLHQESIKNFINNFELQLVHVHVNNWALINKNNLPSAIEITFSPKEFNSKINDSSKSYPLSIDQPCNPKYEDSSIKFFD